MSKYAVIVIVGGTVVALILVGLIVYFKCFKKENLALTKVEAFTPPPDLMNPDVSQDDSMFEIIEKPNYKEEGGLKYPNSHREPGLTEGFQKKKKRSMTLSKADNF